MSWKLVGFPSGLWKSSSSSTQKSCCPFQNMTTGSAWRQKGWGSLDSPGSGDENSSTLEVKGPPRLVKVCSMKMKLLGSNLESVDVFPKKRPNMFDVFFSLTNQHGAFYIKTSWKGRWKADEFNRKRGSSINPFGWRPLSAELLVGDPEFPEGPGWQWSSPQRFFFDVRTSEFPPVCSRKWRNLSQILGPRCVLLEVMVTQF